MIQKDEDFTYDLTNIGISDVQNGAESLDESRSRCSPGTDRNRTTGVSCWMTLNSRNCQIQKSEKDPDHKIKITI